MVRPDSFIVTKVPTNFVYPEIKEEHFKFGSGQLVGTPLRPDGDWRNYLPPEEDQNVRGIESSACYIEAQQHTIATLEEEGLDEPDNNYSARFNALLSGGSENGGDPLRGADSIRHDGMVPDSLMPFGPTINSWADFHSWKDVIQSVVRAEGKKYLGKKILGYDIVCEKYEPVATKYLKLKQSLQYSPCPVSVTAWYQNDGIYYKPEGLSDNHLVELVYIDADNHPYIRDTYAPYLKKLEANFNFDFALRWSCEKKSAEVDDVAEIGVWQQLVDLLTKLRDYLLSQQPPAPPIPTPPSPLPPSNMLGLFALAIQKFEGYTSNPPSRSFRNCNPGNARYSPVGYAPIYLPVRRDPENFAIFKDYKTGFLYLRNLILSKCKAHPEWDLYTFFGEEHDGWAPDSDGNNSRHYAEVVAKALNVAPNWKVGNLLA